MFDRGISSHLLLETDDVLLHCPIYIHTIIALLAPFFGEVMPDAPGSDPDRCVIAVLASESANAEQVTSDPDDPSGENVLFDVSGRALWIEPDTWSVDDSTSTSAAARHHHQSRGPPIESNA